MTSRTFQLPRYALSAVLLAVALLTAYLIGANGARGDGAAPAGGNGSYSILQLEGSEVESYDSLTAMNRAADTVVVGRFTSFGVSRIVQGDDSLDRVVYGAATVEVRRHVSGRSLGSTVKVEFLLPYQEQEARRMAGAFNAALPDGDALFFLRDKGGAEAGRYRLISSAGLWTGTSRGALDAPLLAESPDEHGQFRSEIGKADSVDELADRLARR